MSAYLKSYENCRLCPRQCGADRTGFSKSGLPGFCGLDHELRIAHIGPHFGEEPPISGVNGSGTIFFSGCTLKCSYCQNYQISKEGLGERLTLDELFIKTSEMIDEHKVHNINFVTPDHFFIHTQRLVMLLRDKGYYLPIVYNLSGYQSEDILKGIEGNADIYLPDFKYSDHELAMTFSKAGEYPDIALGAISEMIRQKGFLDSVENESEPARKGVLVRHLILPGKVENSLGVLTALFLEFGSKLPISLMSQYQPVIKHKDEDLNRRITRKEFEKVYSHALDLGFENLFVQFPDEVDPDMKEGLPFLPDFRRQEPFSGNSPDC